MGRSKKNWDHLVDYRGNYGINVKEGYFPGSPNRPGIKGNKGEIGFKGQKGDDGSVGQTGPKGVKGPKGEVGPHSIGPKGEKGEAAGLFLFQGVVSGTNQLPLFNQKPGYTYYVSGENKLYVWDGTQWVPLQDVLAPIKGDKGDEGDQGPKGDPGLDGVDGGRGFDGPKGEKGEKGDDVLLDDFYTQDQIDAILANLYHPEEAFHINFNTKTNSEILVGTVNFESQAQDAPIYNLGLVTIGQQVTVLNSPVPADRLMVVNYVVEDPGQARGLDYTLLQFVYNGAPYEVTDFAYYRRCRPGMGEFSDWRAVGIKKEDYYTKGEIDTLFIEKARQYELKTFPHPDENNQYIRLEELNYGSTSDVQVRGIGGIKITRNQNVLTWDASPLTGQIQFLGMIDAPDDPYVKKPDALPGQYYMYNVGGTAWNGEEVVEGDWVIFGADPEQWNNVDMTQNYGVLNVSVEGGLLEQTGTVNFPNIILEEDTIRDQILYEYLTFDQTAAIFAGQGIQDHNNVVIQTRNNGQQGHYNKPLAQGEPPTFQNGAFSVVTDRNEIQFNKFDSTGTEMDQLLAQAQPGVKHRFEGLAGQGGTYDAVVTDTGNYGGYFYIRYETISPVAMVMAAGEFRVRAYDGLLADDGDSLLYDVNSDLWVPGEAGAGTFVRLKGDTMEGELNMDGNAIKGLPYDPPTDDSAVTKQWVLDQLKDPELVSPGVPVGAMSFWFGSNEPDGYFKCRGFSFDINKYPKLHDHLRKYWVGYTPGILPDLAGRYAGQIGGSGLPYESGKLFDHQTHIPNSVTVTGGEHSHKLNEKEGRGAGNSTGAHIMRPLGTDSKANTYLYEHSTKGGTHSHGLTGGDSVTRPNTFTGYWIIKHD